jgi:outer membrane receptor protein involved in Fe transport
MRNNSHNKFKLLLAATVGVGAISASPAFAQTGGDEIIVTATRRAENIQDVPIAVTAIQPKQLEKQGIVNIQNLASVAPSFSSSNAQTSSGTVVLRIRGVGTTSNNIGFESAVGVFVDGAYQSRPGVALGEFVDVERVEVLRGPQGTLFGRNTSAGALNVTNVRPDLDEVGGFVNATYGNYNHVNLQAAANIPIVEGKVAARITGAVRSREGYIEIHDGNDNIIGESNEIEQHMIRAQVGFDSDSGFKGRVIGDYSKSSAACCSAIEVLQSPVETFGLFNAVGLGARGGMVGPIVATDGTDVATAESAAESLIASSSQVPQPSNQQTGVTVELEHPIGDNADLIYIGSYRQYEAAEQYDSTFSGLDAFNVLDGSDTDINTMTHELRLQGDALDGKLSWLVGGYYSDEKIKQSTKFGLGEDYGELIGALLFGPTGGALGANPLTVFTGVDPSVVRATNNYTQDSKSFSVFTHNIFDVTDDLSLTVGLRYSDESKDGSFSQSDVTNPLCTNAIAAIAGGAVPGALVNTIFGTACFAFTAPADLPAAIGMPGGFLPLPLTFDETFEDDELIYTGKLAYKFGYTASAYASFTHGYKSGGFNLDSTAAVGGGDPSFASELVDAYELGLKTKLLDSRVTLNIAAFLEQFENFQVLEFTGAQFVTFNVPKAETKGVEIEFAANATDNLSFSGGLTLLDANYPDDCAGTQTAINVTSLCGNTLTNAPQTVGIFGANYEGDVNDWMKFFLNAQVRYESDRRTSTQAVVLSTQAPNPFDVQEANSKINLRAGIGGQDDDWALEAWATNITNEVTRAVTFNTVLRSGSRSAFVQQPRMYGVTARRKF